MNESDINWRDINDDRSIFLTENKSREILVETDVAIRIDYAKHVAAYNNALISCNENVKRYAFID